MINIYTVDTTKSIMWAFIFTIIGKEIVLEFQLSNIFWSVEVMTERMNIIDLNNQI